MPDTYVTLATANDLLFDVIALAWADKPEEERPSVSGIKKRLNVSLTESASNARAVPSQMAMTVSFRDGDPERARSALNAWTSLFIERNSQLFSDRTGATSELLAKSVETVQADLKEAEERLLEYNQEHPLSLMKRQRDSIEQTYSTLLSQYEEKIGELVPLEAELEAARALLANEPETKTLTRGMSREALWNLAAQGGPLSDFYVQDEVANSLHNDLKKQVANAEIDIASARASIDDLLSRIGQAQEEYAALNSSILTAETEVARLQQEQSTLQETYNNLSMQYQRSRVATVESIDPIRIVEMPIAPTEPVSNGGMKILVLAVALGLFLGVCAAFLAEILRQRAGKD